MTAEIRPLYGDLVIPFNSESEMHDHNESIKLKEQTRKMIEEAAYYISEKRAFALGRELEDWLEAEAQILRNNLHK